MTELCRHCGSKTEGSDFCCPGCAAAYEIITNSGLSSYYQRRVLDEKTRPPRPEEEASAFEAYIREESGHKSIDLMVDGLHCAACVWLIETILGKTPGVTHARLNMTTRRLHLEWQEGEVNQILSQITALGYRLVPYDPSLLAEDKEGKELLKAMAVAGFAAVNVMLFSVSVWAGHASFMGENTRTLLHWLSALIALPAVAYSIRPFFRSAIGALRAGHTNMDVPISIGVTLACGVSISETIQLGEHAYFDSAISLLFFLLVGRYLDHIARGKARLAAEQLVALTAISLSVLGENGELKRLPPNQVKTGMRFLVASGERIGADGIVLEGNSELDTAIITGESLPQAVGPGDKVFAGAINLGGVLKAEVTAVGDRTLLSEIARLMESASQGRAKMIVLADRVAKRYAPVVHLTALLTFLGWTLFTPTSAHQALLYATAVLIITCPCAIALAVPVVQVVASGRLLKKGILLKSPTALERLAQVRNIAFDKTGTLTLGSLELLPGDWTELDLKQAASLAANSRHPLSKALLKAKPAVPLTGVREYPGLGLEAPDGTRLGNPQWCGDVSFTPTGPAICLEYPDKRRVYFHFQDKLRPDAAQVVHNLQAQGYGVEMLSGDRKEVVAEVAVLLGITQAQAELLPQEKLQHLQAVDKVLMVGDGLNDAPSLAGAYVSLSPATAADIAQTSADAIFQGEQLGAVPELLRIAKRADQLVKQNFIIAIGYNIFAVPLAILGFVNPLIAAIAMSSSSLLVIGNALRLR